MSRVCYPLTYLVQHSGCLELVHASAEKRRGPNGLLYCLQQRINRIRHQLREEVRGGSQYNTRFCEVHDKFVLGVLKLNESVGWLVFSCQLSVCA